MCLSEIVKELKGLVKSFYISSLLTFKPWDFANSLPNKHSINIMSFWFRIDNLRTQKKNLNQKMLEGENGHKLAFCTF